MLAAVYEALMGHSVWIAVEAYQVPDIADLKKASGIIRKKSEPSLQELMIIAEKKGLDIRLLLEKFLFMRFLRDFSSTIFMCL